MSYLILYFFILGLLGFTTYEDIKFRAVSWWVFPAIFILLVAAGLQQISMHEIIWHLKVNALFITIQVLAVWLYLIIRQKALLNPFDEFLGWGDLLFWLALLPAFAPLKFVSFYVLSLVFAMLLHLMLQRTSFYTDTRKIPLAGYQAVFYGIALCKEIFLNY